MFHLKNIVHRTMSSSLLAGMGFAAFLLVSAPVSAQVAPNLLSSGSFSILAGSQVTNTGPSTVSGDVGISPGAGAVGANHPGLTPAMVGGTIHDKDVIAAAAQFDEAAAYTALDLNNACTVTYPGAFKELAGLSLVPGVYCATEFRLSGGTLTLTGLASNTWVFKSTSDLIISGGASAKVVSPSCSVWWRVVSTATFDANSTFAGNILADTSITLAAGASLNGRAFARTAEVTLSSNAISACNILAPTPTPTPIPPTPTPIPPTPTPTPTLTLRTVASPGVTLLAPIFDTATLTGGAAPTGTITFSLYGPNDPICDTTAIFRSTAIVNGDGIYTSASFTPLVIGTYRWRAGYSGDANNAALLTACADVSESVVVSAAGSFAGIPTLSGWGLMTLMVLVVLASIYRLRKI
jgi:Ice-binding-like/IPTL-CTERM motif